MQKFDLRKVITLSFLLFAIGLFYQANFTTDVSLRQIMFARFLQGFGLCIFFLPLVQLSMGEIPKEKYPSASGLFNFIRILVGSGFGTSLSIQVWTRLAIFHHARLGESITSYNPVTTEFYRSLEKYNPVFNENVTTRITEALVTQQAYMLATNDFIWLGAWMFIGLIPLLYLCKPVQPSSSASVGGAH